jgi:hypothetical protein
MPVSNGNGAHAHRDAMSFAVKQVDFGRPGLAVVHGVVEGTFKSAQDAIVLVAVNEDVVAAAASDDILAEKAADSLGAVVPEENSAVPVD